MSRVCELCQRGPTTGNMRSHANNATHKRVHINLQNRKVAGTTYKVCTSCLKTIKKFDKTETKE